MDFQMLLAAFRDAGKEAIEIGRKKRKEKEEAERKRLEAKKKKEQEELQKNSNAAITELTDEEAEKLQREIDAEK